MKTFPLFLSQIFLGFLLLVDIFFLALGLPFLFFFFVSFFSLLFSGDFQSFSLLAIDSYAHFQYFVKSLSNYTFLIPSIIIAVKFLVEVGHLLLFSFSQEEKYIPYHHFQKKHRSFLKFAAGVGIFLFLLPFLRDIW